jgi:pimeloyl-ACP methyl ester carboxylesterase
MEKPPILFLHGAFAGPEVWTRFIAPWFASRGHEVSVPRMPGANPGARLRDYVRSARAAADGFDVPPVVIGYSLGGLVAQHLAAQRKVAGLVLVASPGPWGLGPTLWQLSRAPEVLAALLLAQAGAGSLLGPDEVRRALFTEETPLEWITAVMGQPPASESSTALFDGLTWDLPVWLLVRRAPVLALMGDRDRFVPITDLWSMAMAYGAETELVPGAAHGLPVDVHWRSVAWRINAWLDERSIGSARARDRLAPA